MQDLMPGAFFFPARTRAAILNVFGTMLQSGRTVMAVSTRTLKSDDTSFTRIDAALWGVFTTHKYLAETGDRLAGLGLEGIQVFASAEQDAGTRPVPSRPPDEAAERGASLGLETPDLDPGLGIHRHDAFAGRGRVHQAVDDDVTPGKQFDVAGIAGRIGKDFRAQSHGDVARGRAGHARSVAGLDADVAADAGVTGPCGLTT